VTHSSIKLFKPHALFVGFALIYIFLPAPVLAEPSAELAPEAKPRIESEDKQTQLFVDKKNNIIRIMIEGKEVGRFDKDGLRVFGDIIYAGGTIDAGMSQSTVIKSLEAEYNP